MCNFSTATLKHKTGDTQKAESLKNQILAASILQKLYKDSLHNMIGPSKHSFIYVCAAKVCHLYIVRIESVETQRLHSINIITSPQKSVILVN